MTNLTSLMKAATRIFMLILSVTCILWALLPQYADLFGGMIVGVLAGLINASHLYWRVHRMTDQITSIEQLPKKSPIGFLFRACVALLAAVIATKSLHLSLAAVSVGLITVPMAILAVAYVLNRRDKLA